jgi:hypothetical protein
MSLTDELHIALTEQFVAENPFTVVLSRKVKEPTGTGGFRWVSPDMPINPFQARRVGSGGDLLEQVTAEGHTVIPSWTLIAHPGMDIQIGDTFTFCGNTCEVLKVDRQPPWRVQALVYEHGN